MAKKKEHQPNYESPMLGVTWFRPERCKDCIFRDKTTYEKEGKKIECGWHKSSCRMYPYPEMKPNEIDQCEYYEKEKRKRTS